MAESLPNTSETELLDEEQDLRKFAEATRAALQVSRDDISAMQQSYKSIEETLSLCARSPPKPNVTKVILPEGVPGLVKNAVEKMAAVTDSAKDIQELLDLDLPDFEGHLKKMDERAAALEEKSKSLEQRILALQQRRTELLKSSDIQIHNCESLPPNQS